MAGSHGWLCATLVASAACNAASSDPDADPATNTSSASSTTTSIVSDESDADEGWPDPSDPFCDPFVAAEALAVDGMQRAWIGQHVQVPICEPVGAPNAYGRMDLVSPDGAIEPETNTPGWESGGLTMAANVSYVAAAGLELRLYTNAATLANSQLVYGTPRALAVAADGTTYVSLSSADGPRIQRDFVDEESFFFGLDDVPADFVAPLESGVVTASRDSTILRAYERDGAPTWTVEISPSQRVVSIASDALGRTYVAVFTFGESDAELHRVMPDGTIDPTFSYGWPTSVTDVVALAVDEGGAIICALTTREETHLECFDGTMTSLWSVTEEATEVDVVDDSVWYLTESLDVVRCDADGTEQWRTRVGLDGD